MAIAKKAGYEITKEPYEMQGLFRDNPDTADISDDTVIVEFGNNKNCRIPMQKSAITQVEKPSAE
mgnify:CR=1 FL=1